jgi:hypothetical protein
MVERNMVERNTSIVWPCAVHAGAPHREGEER